MSRLRPLVVIVGPTAVGKTAVSVELASRLRGEIVSADSRLLYRGMDIGTAKPSPEARARVRHHLIDVADPREPWSMAEYRRAAREAIASVQAGGSIPFLVGGTGQYVRAIIEGWQPPPRASDDSVRRELEAFAASHGKAALHARLEHADPQAAQRIDARNVRRVVRALEIYALTGRPASEQRLKVPPDYSTLQIGLSRPRPELYDRIDARIDAMLAAGWVEEVAGLLHSGLDPTSSAMSAIGYRQIARYLSGEFSLEEAKRQIRRASRSFVRRQANWFKAEDEAIHWFEVAEGVESRVEARVREWFLET